MAPTSGKRSKKEINREAWTAEEDEKLAQVIEIHGPTKWKSVADKAGLNRCGKSCRLRWMNYLRPNIKRGDMSDQEEDLIIRLHKLLGNRWSLIAGRLPGRTDNEIKNYWNSHLRKKSHHQNVGQKRKRCGRREDHRVEGNMVNDKVDTSRSMSRLGDGGLKGEGGSDFTFTSSSSLIDDDLCNYHEEYLGDFEWVHQFLEMGDKWFEV